MKDTGGSSINDFCARYGISRGTFYNMERHGTAPQTMRIGARRIIGSQSEDEWRTQREAAEAEETAAFKAKRIKAGPGRPRRNQQRR